jgi:hypothetical protein
MAKIETIRPDLGSSQAVADALPDIAAFRAGRSQDDRLTDLLAFGLAADRGEPATPEVVERTRQEAAAALSDFAFRYLHNTVEQVRRDAVAEHLGQLRQPPGFLRLVLANLVALAVAGLAGWWLALHPEVVAGLSGLLSG